MGVGKLLVLISNLNIVDCNDIISAPIAAEAPPSWEYIVIYVV